MLYIVFEKLEEKKNHFLMMFLSFFAIFTIISIIVPFNASAKTVRWIGDTGNNWTQEKNWDFPIESEDVVELVNNTTSTVDASITISSLTLTNYTLLIPAGVTLRVTGPISLTGGIITGDGTLEMGGDFKSFSSSNPSSILTKQLSLGGVDRVFTVANGPAYYDFTIGSSIIDGDSSAGIIIDSRDTSQGRFDITGTNFYTGTTTIRANSILWVANSSALGSSLGGTVVESGGSLALTTTSPFKEPLSLSGNGYSGWGALIGVYVDAVWDAPIELAAPTSIDSSNTNTLSIRDTFGNGNSLTVGTFTGTSHAGMVRVLGNTSLNTLNVTNGSLDLAETATITVSNNITLKGTSIIGDGTLVLQGNLQTESSPTPAVISVRSVILSPGLHSFSVQDGPATQDFILTTNIDSSEGSAYIETEGSGVAFSNDTTVSNSVTFGYPTKTEQSGQNSGSNSTTTKETPPDSVSETTQNTMEPTQPTPIQFIESPTSTPEVIPMVITPPTDVTDKTPTIESESKNSDESTAQIDILVNQAHFHEQSNTVGELQQQLQQLGFFPVTQTITGFYGPITRRSVRSYLLKKDTLTTYELVLALRRGEGNNRVRKLQQILKNLGFFPAKKATTGFYGPLTQHAAVQYVFFTHESKSPVPR